MKPRKRIVETVAMAALVLLARATSATPLAYDEAISGDLGDTFPATQFTLDVGSNTISGTTHFFSTLVSDDTDFDDFAFVVPVGTHLTGITFGFETVGIPGNTSLVRNIAWTTGMRFRVCRFLETRRLTSLGRLPCTRSPAACRSTPGRSLWRKWDSRRPLRAGGRRAIPGRWMSSPTPRSRNRRRCACSGPASLASGSGVVVSRADNSIALGDLGQATRVVCTARNERPWYSSEPCTHRNDCTSMKSRGPRSC